MGGLRPLHFACGLLGACGVEIVRLLLDAGADRNARVAAGDDGSSYVIQFLEKDWQQDAISDQCAARLGGRTALHIVCARDDNFQVSVRLLTAGHLFLELDERTSCEFFAIILIEIVSFNLLLRS